MGRLVGAVLQQLGEWGDRRQEQRHARREARRGGYGGDRNSDMEAPTAAAAAAPAYPAAAPPDYGTAPPPSYGYGAPAHGAAPPSYGAAPPPTHGADPQAGYVRQGGVHDEQAGGKKRLVVRLIDGVQKLRQEGGLYGEGQEPVPDPEHKFEASEPLSPQHTLSKKRSYFGVLLMGFVLASDWVATLVSIQALYYLQQGPKRLFGLTFGVYDLAALLAIVVFKSWSERTQSYKLPMLVGALIAMAGNLVYAFTVLIDKWWVILIARAISGAGSAVVYLGTPYIGATSATHGENDVKDVRFKGFQNAGQQIMMLVGMIFLKVNTVTAQSSDGTKIFNFYTIQGWILALLILLVVVPFWLWLFQDPTLENEHLCKEKEEDGVGQATEEQRSCLRSLGPLFLLTAFLTIFSMVAFLSNLFALSAAQYQKVHEQNDLFNPFLPVGLGGLGAGIVYKAVVGESRRKLPVPPAFADERFLLVLSNWLLFAAWMLTIPWCGKTCHPSPTLFYVGAACVGVVSSLFIIGMARFVKHKSRQYRHVGSSPFKLMGPVLLLAKFLGPLVIGLVTYMATPEGNVHVCTGQIQNDLCVDLPGQPGSAPYDSQCIVLGDKYYVGGCILYNAIYMYPAMAGLALVNSLLVMAMMAKHWSYAN